MTGLLSNLDAVESFGDDEVWKTKEAVKAIGKELKGLDARKAEAWEQAFNPAVLASQGM